MRRNELEAYFRVKTEKLSGAEQAWTFVAHDVPMQAFTNEAKDRMRIMAMVAIMDEVDVEQVPSILQTNFHADARYALHDELLWAVFVHSLSGLTESDLSRGLRQVARLVTSFGAPVASGPPRFEWPRPSKPEGVRRRTVETVQESLDRALRRDRQWPGEWD